MDLLVKLQKLDLSPEGELALERATILWKGQLQSKVMAKSYINVWWSNCEKVLQDIMGEKS